MLWLATYHEQFSYNAPERCAPYLSTPPFSKTAIRLDLNLYSYQQALLLTDITLPSLPLKPPICTFRGVICLGCNFRITCQRQNTIGRRICRTAKRKARLRLGVQQACSTAVAIFYNDYPHQQYMPVNGRGFHPRAAAQSVLHDCPEALRLSAPAHVSPSTNTAILVGWSAHELVISGLSWST